MNFNNYSKLFIHQVFEIFETIGFETRNKYEILDETKNTVGFAAEQGKGLFGFFMRQYLGHWRSFEVHFFDNRKSKMMIAKHPFRFYFEKFDIFNNNNEFIGSLEKKFSILTKKFDVLDKNGNIIFEMRSPLLSIWKFPFYKNGKEIAKIEKKWTGILAEVFTDKDTFLIDYGTDNLDDSTKKIILAASIFIDLRFFERKSGR